jgi:Mrp family chromosome partitioning ATPase
MLRGRGRLPLLAEIAGPAEGSRGWGLTGRDFEALGAVLPQLAEHRVTAVAGEGEEPLVAAIALASAAAAVGRRTILVECDLARPRLAPHVGLGPAPGLHEYLRWEAEPADVVQPVALAGPASADTGGQLICVSGGRPAIKPETLLGLQSFAHVVEKLRAGYELVLLVAPPVLGEPVAARAAVSQADAVVAGVSADQAEGRAGGDVRAAIRRLPAPALGAITVGT